MPRKVSRSSSCAARVSLTMSFMATSVPSFWKVHSLTTLPVSTSALYTLLLCAGLSMFMRRSRFISMSLLGVKPLPPGAFLGVMLNDVPVSCMSARTVSLKLCDAKRCLWHVDLRTVLAHLHAAVDVFEHVNVVIAHKVAAVSGAHPDALDGRAALVLVLVPESLSC